MSPVCQCVSSVGRIRIRVDILARAFHQVSPVAVVVFGGTGGRHGADDGGQHARHAVQVVHAARVVNAHFAVDGRLLVRVAPKHTRQKKTQQGVRFVPTRK